MRTVINSNHFSDSEGRPSGGTTFGQGFSIGWQNGPLEKDGERLEPNGAFVEDIISAAMDRLGYYQTTKFACTKNDQAIRCLKQALQYLEMRTHERQMRGVEGTHDV